MTLLSVCSGHGRSDMATQRWRGANRAGGRASRSVTLGGPFYTKDWLLTRATATQPEWVAWFIQFAQRYFVGLALLVESS